MFAFTPIDFLHRLVTRIPLPRARLLPAAMARSRPPSFRRRRARILHRPLGPTTRTVATHALDSTGRTHEARVLLVCDTCGNAMRILTVVPQATPATRFSSTSTHPPSFLPLLAADATTGQREAQQFLVVAFDFPQPFRQPRRVHRMSSRPAIPQELMSEQCTERLFRP